MAVAQIMCGFEVRLKGGADDLRNGLPQALKGAGHSCMTGERRKCWMEMLIGFLPSREAGKSLLSWWLPCSLLLAPPPLLTHSK